MEMTSFPFFRYRISQTCLDSLWSACYLLQHIPKVSKVFLDVILGYVFFNRRFNNKGNNGIKGDMLYNLYVKYHVSCFDPVLPVTLLTCSDQSQHGSLFTLFLYNPLLAFTSVCGLNSVQRGSWNRAQEFLYKVYQDIGQMITRSQTIGITAATDLLFLPVILIGAHVWIIMTEVHWLQFLVSFARTDFCWLAILQNQRTLQEASDSYSFSSLLSSQIRPFCSSLVMSFCDWFWSALCSAQLYSDCINAFRWVPAVVEPKCEDGSLIINHQQSEQTSGSYSIQCTLYSKGPLGHWPHSIDHKLQPPPYI